MTFKGLLLGAAAALVTATGAQAQDGGSEEYVRVCDVYGTGYYYIPGTETCLNISGYVRYDIHYVPAVAAVAPGRGVFGQTASDAGYVKYSRFSTTFSAKSETEMGTLSTVGTANVEWTRNDILGIDATPNAAGETSLAYGTWIALENAYIELAGVRIGKSDSPYSRFLGYGPNILYYDGIYGFNGSSSEISYTYTGANGFSAIAAAVADTTDSDWVPNFEAGVNYAQGWGSIGAIVGYDEGNSNWGAKLVARYAPEGSMFNASLHVFYSSPTAAAGMYTITDDYGGTPTVWSVMAGAGVTINDRVSINGAAQWFDTGNWYLAANAPIVIAGSLTMTPEVAYFTASNSVYGMLRFQAGF